jgi:Flp pilus assembly protein TadB
MIDKKEKKQLKKASAHHSKKHMDMMVRDMKAGLSFTKAHKKAVKKVGK